jgi:hypothetical protein
MYNIEIHGFNSSEATTWIIFALPEPAYTTAALPYSGSN